MISDNINEIRSKITSACKKTGRNPKDICIVAVTKTKTAEIINEAYNFGLRNFGENKVQELTKKIDSVPKDINWHFIGHLQRNKVKDITSFVHLIHSVDSMVLAQEIDKHGMELKKRFPILIQVNTSKEKSKFGIKPEEVEKLVGDIAALSFVKVVGLMTIGPLVENPEEARPCFKLLRELKEKIVKLNIPNVEMKHLSMGMTNDYEIAIEEGATIIRVGTAIFGKRK